MANKPHRARRDQSQETSDSALAVLALIQRLQLLGGQLGDLRNEFRETTDIVASIVSESGLTEPTLQSLIQYSTRTESHTIALHKLAIEMRKAVLQPTAPTSLTLSMPYLSQPLSERETEVLRILAQGADVEYVADVLVITEGTVRGHLDSIYSKLNIVNRKGVNQRGMALRWAYDQGIL